MRANIRRKSGGKCRVTFFSLACADCAGCRVRVLLAGYGFVGSVLASLLKASGHEITVLRRQPAGAMNGIEFVTCDLICGRPFDARKQFDAVIFSLAPDERSDAAYTATYCSAQQNLQAMVDASHYVYISSTAVYPESAGTWREADATAHSSRARILLEAEQIAQQMPHSAVLRFAGLYNSERRIYYGPPATVGEDRLVHFLHRDDAARAVTHVLARRLSGVFNVHDGHPQWRSDVLRRLGFLDAPLPRTGERRISAEKLFATGFVPRYADYFAGLDAPQAT